MAGILADASLDEMIEISTAAGPAAIVHTPRPIAT